MSGEVKVVRASKVKTFLGDHEQRKGWVFDSANSGNDFSQYILTSDTNLLATSPFVSFKKDPKEVYESIRATLPPLPHPSLHRERPQIGTSRIIISRKYILPFDVSFDDFVIFIKKVKRYKISYGFYRFKNLKDRVLDLFDLDIHQITEVRDYYNRTPYVVYDPKKTKRILAARKGAETRRQKQGVTIGDARAFLNSLYGFAIEPDGLKPYKRWMGGVGIDFKSNTDHIRASNIGSDILVKVGIFDQMFGKNAHRKLPTFQRLKTKWKKSNQPAKDKFEPGFNRWMEKEARSRNCESVSKINDLITKQPEAWSYLEYE